MKTNNAHRVLVLAFLGGAVVAAGVSVAVRNHERDDVDADGQVLDDNGAFQPHTPMPAPPANALDRETILKLRVGDFWEPEELVEPGADGTHR